MEGSIRDSDLALSAGMRHAANLRDLNDVSDAVRSAQRILRFDDLFSAGFDVGRGVAGIDDELCVLDDPVVVIG